MIASFLAIIAVALLGVTLIETRRRNEQLRHQIAIDRARQ